LNAPNILPNETAGVGSSPQPSSISRSSTSVSRPLPSSMSSLRAFEAVARRESFTKAGLELHQTQTAISHQIRKLETFLGVPLFLRERDGIRLSEYGKEYLHAVRNALDILSSSTKRILEINNESSFSIVSLAAFGLKCLLPLLPEFRRQFPEISVNFESVVSYSATANYNHDISIRYGNGNWPGMSAYKVAQEELFPVCSPEFLAQHQFDDPHDILRHPVICTSSLVFRDDWPEWLSHAGCSGEYFSAPIVCDTMLSASQAAVDGLGIALGRTPLINRDLEAGRLVRPFDINVPSATGYYLTISNDRADRKVVKLFTEWFLAQFDSPRH